ncbi:hypothetical protein IPG36_07985 [bacterium]|nr:MAG: hypothetical protein IPG36_07985 [bacterium]
MKIAYSQGQLGPKSKAAVEEAVSGDIEVWLSGVELSLGEFDKVDHLPSKILLCGGGTGLPQITEALKGKDWYKNLPFARRPSVSHISPAEVSRVKDTTGKLTSFADITPMGLANLGLDLVGGESTTDTLMRKLAISSYFFLKHHSQFTYFHTHVITQSILESAVQSGRSLEMDVSVNQNDELYVGHPESFTNLKIYHCPKMLRSKKSSLLCINKAVCIWSSIAKMSVPFLELPK